MDENLSPKQKMSKARAQLILKSHLVFFGSLAMRLKMHEDFLGVTKTAATDGKRVVYDPNYIGQLTTNQCITEIAHEVLHVALKHNFRRGNRNPKIWNIACDIVVDNILKGVKFRGSSTFEWGPICAADPSFADQSVEQIYNTIIKMAQDTPGSGSQGGQNNMPDPSGDKTTGEDQGNQDSKQQQQQFGNVPNGENQLPGQDEKALKEKLEELENSQDPSTGGQPQKQNQNQQIPPDMPQPHGEVYDAPVNFKDENEIQQAIEDQTIAVQSAAINAKNTGSLPGNIEEEILADREHKIDYRDLLREWMDKNVTPGDYDWMHPDKRYIDNDIYLPGLSEEEDNPKIVFAVDTSGSIGKEEKDIFSAEISGVLEEFNASILAMYCDTDVRNTQQLETDDMPIKLNWAGGGGTRFKPVFDYIKNNDVECEAVLFFTDMWAGDWNQLHEMGDPGVPVLWMCSDYRYFDNRKDFKLPFGHIIELEIDDIDER